MKNAFGRECQSKKYPLMLSLARYRLQFEHATEMTLPDFTGSAWRGALGHALKKVVCVTHLDTCPPCLLYRSCPYPYIFETPPPLTASKMRKYTAAPHPFVLEPPISPNDSDHELGLTLVGRGNGSLPYLIHALQRAGERGLGKGRARMRLLSVYQAVPVEADAWVPIYEPGGDLEPLPPDVPTPPPQPRFFRLRLETPLRLQREGHLVTPKSFRFSDLFGSLLRRISMLTYFHTDTPLATDFGGLMDRARQVQLVETKFAWKDWTRYSSRQKTAMKMGGLVGDAVVEATPESPFWPFLWLGQWVHTGKGTSMGLGRYMIEPASLPLDRSVGV